MRVNSNLGMLMNLTEDEAGELISLLGEINDGYAISVNDKVYGRLVISAEILHRKILDTVPRRDYRVKKCKT